MACNLDDEALGRVGRVRQRSGGVGESTRTVRGEGNSAVGRRQLCHGPGPPLKSTCSSWVSSKNSIQECFLWTVASAHAMTDRPQSVSLFAPLAISTLQHFADGPGATVEF